MGYSIQFHQIKASDSRSLKLTDLKEQFFVMLVSRYCLWSCPGGPISIILLHNSNRTLYPALALPAVGPGIIKRKSETKRITWRLVKS